MSCQTSKPFFYLRRPRRNKFTPQLHTRPFSGPPNNLITAILFQRWNFQSENVYLYTIDSSGVGSVEELMFWVFDPDYQCGPDWTYLANTVSIDTVTMLRGMNDMPRYCFFCSIKAKCLKFGPYEYEFFWTNEHPEWLNKFEKLILVLNVTTNFAEWFTGQDNPYTIRLWPRRRSGS